MRSPGRGPALGNASPEIKPIPMEHHFLGQGQMRQKGKSVSNKITDSSCEIMNKVAKPERMCYN